MTDYKKYIGKPGFFWQHENTKVVTFGILASVIGEFIPRFQPVNSANDDYGSFSHFCPLELGVPKDVLNPILDLCIPQIFEELKSRGFKIVAPEFNPGQAVLGYNVDITGKQRDIVFGTFLRKTSNYVIEVNGEEVYRDMCEDLKKFKIEDVVSFVEKGLFI